MAKAEEPGEKAVQEEIEKILEADAEEEAANENDMLRNRKHNARVDVSEAQDEPEDATDECDAAAEDLDEEEDFETTETVREDADGEVELDESDVIDSSLMKMWCRQSVEVR